MDYVSPSHIPFACRESELHPSDRSVVDEMAAHLLAQRGLTRVRLIGTQSRTGPEGALPTDLARRRAATVMRELERSGIDRALISIVEEESGYRHKRGRRRKNEPDACTDELFDRRRSRSVEVRYTLCCPRRTIDGLTAECPFTPRTD
jgi:outer membrane protein OmpA-like peptidoglycan-associated protein